jgi:hypothetical protein
VFRVAGHTKDKKLDGFMGALECEMPHTGVRFKIGTGFNQTDRRWANAKKKWKVGTVISYKYQGLTTANKVPRFASYIRVRGDKTWKECVADAAKDAAAAAAASLKPAKLTRNPSLMAADPPQAGDVDADSDDADEDDVPLSSFLPLFTVDAGVTDAVDDGDSGGDGDGDGDAGGNSKRRRCQYGGECFQRNKVHKQEFAHPGESDYDEADADVVGGKRKRAN